MDSRLRGNDGERGGYSIVRKICSTPAKAGVQHRAAHDWDPAFAGVVVSILFPREGGDPDWAPAFAGAQGRRDVSSIESTIL